MRFMLGRFLAVLLLVIPGWAATYGFLLMKNALFAYFAHFGDEAVTPQLAWGKLFIGFVMFVSGIAFIGGWIFYRDRKRNYVAPRFMKKNRARRRRPPVKSP